MKRLLALALIGNIAGVYASDTIKSKTVKKLICYDVESGLSDDYDINSFDYDKCMQGVFTTNDAVYNDTYQTTTLMDVDFSFKYDALEIEGSSQAYRTFTVNRAGAVKKSWGIRSTKINLVDNRSLTDVLDVLFDYDSGSIDVHNGDLGYTKVDSSKVTLESIVKDLDESLENYGNPDTDGEYDFCQYETDTNMKATLHSLEYHSSEAYELLKRLEKEGRIKFAVSREYVDGASEYCSHYYYEILTTEDVLIYFYFDFTT